MGGGEEGGGGRGDAGEGGGGILTLVLPFVLMRRLLCPLLAKRNDKQITMNNTVYSQSNDLECNSNATLAGAHWYKVDRKYKGCARVEHP